MLAVQRKFPAFNAQDATEANAIQYQRRKAPVRYGLILSKVLTGSVRQRTL